MVKLIFAVCFLFSSIVFGQTIETDRPDQTESSSVVPKGTVQIETGSNMMFTQDEFLQPVRELQLPTTLFRVGLLPVLELRVVNSLVFEHTTAFFGEPRKKHFIDDVEVGFKLSLLNKEEGFTQIAFMSHLVIPLALNESYQYSSVNKLLISHSLPGPFSLGYNVGFNYYNEDLYDLNYSLAFGYALSDELGVYVEGYGAVQNLSQWLHNMDAGITYLCSENFQLDYSFGLGLNTSMVYQSIGLSVRLPN